MVKLNNTGTARSIGEKAGAQFGALMCPPMNAGCVELASQVGGVVSYWITNPTSEIAGEGAVYYVAILVL